MSKLPQIIPLITILTLEVIFAARIYADMLFQVLSLDLLKDCQVLEGEKSGTAAGEVRWRPAEETPSLSSLTLLSEVGFLGLMANRENGVTRLPGADWNARPPPPHRERAGKTEACESK